MIRHAEWCDVAAVNGSWVWAYVERPSRLTCEMPAGVAWSLTLPEWLLHVRCAAMGAHVAVIGQGHDTGLLRLVIDGRLLVTGNLSMFGRSVIRAVGDRWELAVQIGPTMWRWLRLMSDGTWVAFDDYAMPETSQGFLRWDADGPIRTDDAREYRLDGRVALLYPQIAGALVLGQHPTGNRVTGIWQGQRVRVADIDAFEPYGVALAGEGYAIASRTPYGAELQIVHPPFALDPFEPDPPPEPPTPTPEPTPAPPAPTPTPTPIPPEPDPMPPSQDQIKADTLELVRFYNDPDGLNRRGRNLPSPLVANDPAIWDWVAVAIAHGVEEAKRQIRTFPEYQEQHPLDPQ